MDLCRRAERAEWMDNSSVRESDAEGEIKGGWVLLWWRALSKSARRGRSETGQTHNPTEHTQTPDTHRDGLCAGNQVNSKPPQQ